MKSKASGIKYYLLMIIIAYISATILHFTYDLLGRFPLFAGLMPISESIWEHLKLVFYPTCIVFLCPWNKLIKEIPITTRVIMAALAVIIGKLFVATGYYGLKYGFTIEGIVSDCLLLLIALMLGIYHGLSLKKYFFPAWVFWLCLLYLVTDVLLFYVFSFWIPDLPIFQPPISETVNGMFHIW